MHGTVSLNSVTNFLHALALGTYSWLVYESMRAGDPLYTAAILYTFLLIFFLKIVGVVVHLKPIERDRLWSTILWSVIAVGVCFLNYALLVATNMPTPVVIGGMAVTLVCVALFLNSLRTELRFAYIAGAVSVVYLVVAVFTCGDLRLGLILTVLSNIAWIILVKVPYLFERGYHNDIYHIALIVSTYVLYDSVSTGLWQGGCV